MKKATMAIIFSLCFSLLIGGQIINSAKANPISIPSVPSLQISYPLTSTGGYVNSTVEFHIYVNMPIESQTINSISYSVDGEQSMNLEDLKVNTVYDYSPEKIDFKTYTASLILKDLSEGNHTLNAHVNGMSASRDFVVNSYYHVTALNVLSPNSPIYSTTVPLTFSFTGEITNAHYYLYRGQELVSENPLTGNVTLDNLFDGSYNLYVFVTTQYGQDSKAVPFYVAGPATIAGVTILLIFALALGVWFFSKKLKQKK